jgi:hypothetical protein
MSQYGLVLLDQSHDRSLRVLRALHTTSQTQYTDTAYIIAMEGVRTPTTNEEILQHKPTAVLQHNRTAANNTTMHQRWEEMSILVCFKDH